MKKTTDKRGAPLPIGLASLLVTLTVLALTVFALLTLSTVRAESRLRQQTEEAVLDYYAADCAAAEILARLRCGEVPAGVRQEDDRFFYACTISPTQTLRVEVQICGTDARILRWQAVSTAQWETDENLPVWNGGEEGAAP